MPSVTRRITFIGIGSIGLPMAEQLSSAGFDITGVDPFVSQREQAAARGLAVESAPDSAAVADVVVCMVATPEQLRTAVLGDNGVLRQMHPGSVLLIMSTVGPSVVRDVVAESPSEIYVLDVPVTGGVAGAAAGELRLFASGAPDVVDSVRPVLDALGTVIDCGTAIGQGQSYKTVNQLLCSVHLAAAGEALALGEKLGLEPEDVLSAVSSGAGGSWMLSDRGPRMLEGSDGQVTSTIGIFVKDSTLVKEIAQEADFDAPLLRAAQSRFLAAEAAGLERRDDSQVIQTYRK